MAMVALNSERCRKNRGPLIGLPASAVSTEITLTDPMNVGRVRAFADDSYRYLDEER